MPPARLVKGTSVAGGLRLTATLIDAALALTLLPVLGGSLFGVAAAVATWRFCRGATWRLRRGAAAPAQDVASPPMTLLKPIYGLEPGLAARLRSTCLQDYPDYQVIFCLQRPDDPALPLALALAEEFPDRAQLVLHEVQLGPNGKVNNLLGGMAAARHDILVISDSDVELRPDYLATLAAAFADPAIGCVNTLFKATGARRWYERLELLSINAEFLPSVCFTWLTGASPLCLGPSVAIRRGTLARIGGLEALVDYLAEDYEIGRRVPEAGEGFVLLPYIVDARIDLAGPAVWWRHQVYWDQNTRAAQPTGFLLTILTRAVPFALMAALLAGLAPWSLLLLAATLALRLAAAAIALGALDDREGLASLAWLPLRDLVGLVTWLLAFADRTVTWRGQDYTLTGGGRMVVKPQPAAAGRRA